MLVRGKKDNSRSYISSQGEISLGLGKSTPIPIAGLGKSEGNRELPDWGILSHGVLKTYAQWETYGEHLELAISG